MTDPGSELADLARERRFDDVFESRPDIGGRYSALSLFGLVPAVLAGLDAGALLEGARVGLDECGPGVAPGSNPALSLASAMAAGVGHGGDKCTVEPSDEMGPLAVWIEQLVAESLGKDGTGVVPVVDERPARASAYGADRLFVVDSARRDRAAELVAAGHPVLAFDFGGGLGALGRAVVVWELAVAWCGAALGVQPFDQPDVAAAKAATLEVLAGRAGQVPEPVALDMVLAQVRPGDHVALQAFVDPRSGVAHDLEVARLELRTRLGNAVTLGFGPRFLHSTGQLHKGGPPGLVCIQVVDAVTVDDIAVPGRSETFGALERAQADGDLLALRSRGRRAWRVHLEERGGVQVSRWRWAPGRAAARRPSRIRSARRAGP